jgi:hypothetical protein
MADDADKRYTVKVGFEERMFLETEHNRLRREALRRSGELETVTYGETVGAIIAELSRYRDECTCLDEPAPDEPPELSGAVEAHVEGSA